MASRSAHEATDRNDLVLLVADGVAPRVGRNDVGPVLALGKDKGRDDEDGVPIELGQVLDPPKRLLLQADGSAFVARGGNDYDGAQEWVPANT